MKLAYKPCPYKPGLLYLNRAPRKEAGASQQHCLSNYPRSWLPSTCISQQSGEEEVRKMTNFHLVPSSPRSHWLTFTSQYDADAIYLSPPDITTVHPAAGARGPHTISIAYKHITLSLRSHTHLRLTFALTRCTGYCHNKTLFTVGKVC